MASTEEEINLRFNGLTDAERELNDVARGATRAARVTDHLARAFDNLEEEAGEAQRALDRVNDEIAENGPSEELNAELARLQRRLSDISGERFNLEQMRAQFRTSTASAARLDNEIENVRQELNRLNREYAQGGDPAVLEQMRAQQRALDRLSATRRRIAQDDQADQIRLARMAEDARRAQARREDEERRRSEDEDNSSFLRRLRRRAGSVGDGLQGAPVPPAARAVGGAIGAAAAVPLLAAIGGALTGAVGAGIAGAGIAGAIMGDPETFKAEWAGVTDTLKTDFLDATAIFAGPTLDAIKSIGPLVDSWNIDEVFADAAKFVGPLVKGVEGFASGIVRGVSAMVNKGEPAVEALSSGLAEMGDAAGDAFTSIADGAEGGAEALRDVLFFTAGAIRFFGQLTEAAENTYGFIHDHPIESAIFSGGLSIPLSILDHYSDKTEQVGVALEDTGRKGGTAGDAIADAWKGAEAAMAASADTADRLYDAQMGGVEASVAWEQSIDDLTDSIKQNGKNWDIATQKGRDNTTALQDAINAAKTSRDANIANGESVASANAKYEAQIAYLRGVATSAGLTKAQFDAMTAALLNYINTPANKTVTTKFVDVHYVSNEGRIGDGSDPRRQTGSAYAAGGTVAATGVSLFGENGPELRFANKNDYIATAAQTRQMLSGAGPGGGSTPPALLLGSDGSRLGDVLIDLIATAVRGQGGRPELLGIKVGG